MFLSRSLFLFLLLKEAKEEIEKDLERAPSLYEEKERNKQQQRSRVSERRSFLFEEASKERKSQLNSFLFKSKHRLDCRDDAARTQHRDREEGTFRALDSALKRSRVRHRAGVEEAGSDEEGGDAGERGARE